MATCELEAFRARSLHAPSHEELSCQPWARKLNKGGKRVFTQQTSAKNIKLLFKAWFGWIWFHFLIILFDVLILTLGARGYYSFIYLFIYLFIY